VTYIKSLAFGGCFHCRLNFLLAYAALPAMHLGDHDFVVIALITKLVWKSGKCWKKFSKGKLPKNFPKN